MFLHPEGPAWVSYAVACDAGWRTREGTLRGRVDEILRAGGQQIRVVADTATLVKEIPVGAGAVVLASGARWRNLGVPGYTAYEARILAERDGTLWAAECGVVAVGADNMAWDVPGVRDPETAPVVEEPALSSAVLEHARYMVMHDAVEQLEALGVEAGHLYMASGNTMYQFRLRGGHLRRTAARLQVFRAKLRSTGFSISFPL